MKKQTKNISLNILTIISASILNSCAKPDPNNAQTCVNDAGVVVDDSFCKSRYSPGYMWYYGGSRLFYPGSHVSGGSYSRSPGRSYFSPNPTSHSTSSSITRGGFGSTIHNSSIGS